MKAFVPFLRQWSLALKLIRRPVSLRCLHGNRARPRRMHVGIGLNADGRFFLWSLLVSVAISSHNNLNVGYLILFGVSLLLIGCALAGSAVLQRIELSLPDPGAPVRCGESVPVDLQILVRGASTATIEICAPQAPHNPLWSGRLLKGLNNLQLEMSAGSRGLHPVPVLLIQTRWPLGLWRVYVQWASDGDIAVYPQAEVPMPTLPQTLPASPHETAQSQAVTQGGSAGADEVMGLQPVLPGASPTRVHWRSVARSAEHAPLVELAMSSNPPGALCLTLAQALREVMPGHGGKERALSRLSAWVDRANQESLPFSLSLGTQAVPIGHGPGHLQRCRMLLAMEPADEADVA